ncbi:hypothetical protein OFC18_30650, partial [Escherichia coli]|nr:hypothetical protein [Escherichia coli]
YLGESPNLHRWNCTPDTLYYVSTGNKKWKELYFYDKVKVRKSQKNTSGIDGAANLLRMELRLERSPNSRFKRKFLFIKDLPDPLFHR